MQSLCSWSAVNSGLWCNKDLHDPNNKDWSRCCAVLPTLVGLISLVWWWWWGQTWWWFQGHDWLPTSWLLQSHLMFDDNWFLFGSSVVADTDECWGNHLNVVWRPQQFGSQRWYNRLLMRPVDWTAASTHQCFLGSHGWWRIFSETDAGWWYKLVDDSLTPLLVLVDVLQ